MKTFKYRLYPKKSQVTTLNKTLELCRQTYNRIHEYRKDKWENEHKNVGKYDIQKLLPMWKTENSELKLVYSQVLQDVNDRVDKAYQSFFRRIKRGENPGYPRFKGRERYDSITYTQSGFVLERQILHLSKIGDIPIITHRNTEGIIKTCIIRKTRTGKWFVSLVCDNGITATKPNGLPPVGIDLGIKNFVALSTGETISPPMFLKRDANKLSKAQRKLSKSSENIYERKKSLMIVSRIHERISNRRKDFAHKLSRNLINRFGIIIFEDLNIKKMVGLRTLSKNIYDVAWNQLVQMTQNKAEEAGSRVILVDPYNTSQMCSGCGSIVKKDLNIRIHKCPHCGLVADRDINAANNILGLGLQSIGIKS